MTKLTTRSATAEDYPTFTRLFPELEVEDPLPGPEVFEGRMMATTIIAEADGAAAGYAYYLVYGGATLHVGHVVTDPLMRRRGVGVALLEALRREAKREGCSRWYLNVKQGNTAALRLYESCGFAVEHDSWAVIASWDVLSAFPPDAPGAAAKELAADDDGRFEGRFGMERGRLAALRSREGVILAGLSSDEPLGLVAFDPNFPGMYPIRLAAPELAGPLFAFLRPRAIKPNVHIVIEGDALLRDALVARGGTLHESFHRMSGTP
jgi:GNAT superfamily N-acetyltransferase